MSQTDVVISGVKRMLSSRRLRPADRLLVEKDLAAELQVSRGSLREGVRVNQCTRCAVLLRPKPPQRRLLPLPGSNWPRPPGSSSVRAQRIRCT